jgi:peptide/nickel transport system permease protein
MPDSSKVKRNKQRSSFLKDLFTKKPVCGASMILLMLFVIVAIFADIIAPYPMVNGQLQVDVLSKLEPSSPAHLFGTDGLGRDLLTYLIYGARTSVILCVVCTVLSTVVSVAIGVVSAVLGGKADLAIQRLVDAWQCIPAILILLIIMSMLGKGIPQLIIAIAIPGGIAGSRMIRSAAIAVKDSGYMNASRLLGGSKTYRMLRHVLPNILPIVIIGLASSLGGVVMMEATLNFLGFGVDPGTPSWGYLITNQGRTYMFMAPQLALYPGILITLLVLSSAMFGDGVRDLLDPRLKGGLGSYDPKKSAAAMQKRFKKTA